MFELYGLFKLIRPSRLLKQLCLTQSRCFFESYALAVRVLRLSIAATNSFACKELMWSRFFYSRFFDRAPGLPIHSPSGNQCDPDFSVRVLRSSIGLPICSPSRNQLDPTFFLQTGESVRRVDHLWVRSRVDVHLDFVALACHPRTTDERIYALALGTCFFAFSFFVFCFSFFFLSLFKSSFRTKHHTSHA